MYDKNTVLLLVKVTKKVKVLSCFFFIHLILFFNAYIFNFFYVYIIFSRSLNALYQLRKLKIHTYVYNFFDIINYKVIKNKFLIFEQQILIQLK